MLRIAPWRSLFPGLAIVAVILTGVAAILSFARIGALHGDTFGIVVLTNDASDLSQGSEVWLAGQKVGLVDRIDFRPPSADSSYPLQLDLSILSEARPLLRADSRARVARGGTLLGAPVLALSVGTPSAQALQDGDTIRAVDRAGIASMTSRLAELQAPATELRDNVVALSGGRSWRGDTTGTAAGGHVAPPDTRRLAAALATVVANAREAHGDGTMSRTLGDGDIGKRTRRLAARMDSLRTMLASNEGSVGRFRRDSTLPHQLASLRDELSILRALASQPTGTVGGVRSDGTLADGLEQLGVEFDALVTDMKRNPFRYLIF